MTEKIRGSLQRPTVKVKTEGLEDGGITKLNCKCCEENLADIFITRPTEGQKIIGRVFEWKIYADCPHCGMQSEETIVKGGFHIGEPENGYTRHADTQIENNKIHILTVKGGV